jgi:hypothetical protein
MQMMTVPVAMPEDLLADVRRVARNTGLSMADVIRQSAKKGLPGLERELASQTLKPFSSEEEERCWGKPDPEFDALAAHCAALQTVTKPEFE